MERENIICYFSGTGNTYWAAREIAKTLGNCELINIAQFDFKEKLKASRIGIFYPIYYWGLPIIIRKFSMKANIETDYLFELHTMGGYDGVATRQLADCLHNNENAKQNKVFPTLDASYRLKLPNNIALLNKSNAFTDVCRIPNEKTIEKLFQKAEQELPTFSSMIKEKRENRYDEPLQYRLFRKYGYQLNERKCAEFSQKGKFFSSTLENSCTGCGKCSKVCPKNNIAMVEGKPIWNEQCEFCLACLHACPVGAINIEFSKGKARYYNPKLL